MKKPKFSILPDHLRDVRPELAAKGAPGARDSMWFRRLAIANHAGQRHVTIDTRIGGFAQSVIAKQYAQRCCGFGAVSAED